MKKIILFTLCLLCIFSLFSCKSNGTDQTTDTSASDSLPNNLVYDDEYIKKHLPSEYMISYNVTTDDETVSCSVTKTELGVLIDMGDGDPILFVRAKDESGYDMYSKDGDGKFQKVDIGGVTMTDAIVNSSLVSFSGWFTAYTDRKDGLVSDGQAEVAGRQCYRYKYTVSDTSYSMYYADIDTGVCLKYEPFNIEDKEFDYTFECTEFKTENITLPQY